MLRSRLVPALLFAFVCPGLLAQYTAGKIIFKNSGDLAQRDLEAVARLHSGQKLSTPELQAAAQRLIDTGYFDDVGVGLEGAVNALSITFTLKPLPASRMTAAGFENFVWLTPAERDAALHTAVPLFHGQLPDAGNQTDAITTALHSALTAKGVSATVTHETIEPSMSQPVRAVEYRVDRPVVRVHSAASQNVSPALAPEVTKLAEKLRGTRYNEGLAADNTLELLLSPFRNAGLLEAKLNGLQRTIAQSTPADVEVDVTASVTEGQPYRVASINFAGTPLIPAAAVQSVAKLHPGDIASHKLLLETLAPIDETYRRQGYMDVFVGPGPKLDTAAHTVSYTVTVTPGEQYRLRSVNAVGLATEAQRDFDAGWRMKVGDLYDPVYAANFLKNNTALRALAPYAASFQASADPQTHTVDLTIKFVRTANAR